MEWWLPEAEESEEWRNAGQRVKPSIIRLKSSGNLMYSMMMTINNTIL